MMTVRAEQHAFCSLHTKCVDVDRKTCADLETLARRIDVMEVENPRFLLVTAFDATAAEFGYQC